MQAATLEDIRDGLVQLIPGMTLEQYAEAMSEALAAGSYDCTATFTAYDTTDAENPIEVGTAAAKITISVLS